MSLSSSVSVLFPVPSRSVSIDSEPSNWNASLSSSTPSLSSSGSQAFPRPSSSKSDWSKFRTKGQLSRKSEMPSPSLSTVPLSAPPSPPSPPSPGESLSSSALPPESPSVTPPVPLHPKRSGESFAKKNLPERSTDAPPVKTRADSASAYSMTVSVSVDAYDRSRDTTARASPVLSSVTPIFGNSTTSDSGTP